MGVRLVVGLGNPGAEHRYDRHNLGFMVVDLLAQELGFTFSDRGEVAVGTADVDGAAVAFVKPLTFMNCSGPAVQRYARRRCVEPQEILVIADDFHVPFGVLRLRVRGSSGGHKGLASLAACLGTDAFPRLRVGIGPVPAGEDARDFVLRPFGRDDRVLLTSVTRTAVALVLRAVRSGVENVTVRATAAAQDA